MRLAIRCLQIILLQALLLFFLLATHAKAAFALSVSNLVPHSPEPSFPLSSYAIPDTDTNTNNTITTTTTTTATATSTSTSTATASPSHNDHPFSPLQKREPDSTSLADPVTTSIPATATKTTHSPSSHSDTPPPPPPLPTVATNDTNSNHTSSIVDGKAVVKTDLQCDFGDAFCNKVLAAVDGAAQAFSQVVSIKIGILLKVHYYSFCDTACTNGTYAWGAPSSQFTLPYDDGVDQNYVYPQALAKQLAPYSNTSVWADHDIDIEINHDAYLSTVDFDDAKANGWNGTGVPPGGKFWFKGDPPIESDQIDMEYIILHELLHGAGFISSWAAYFYSKSSPFRGLIDDLFDDQDLKMVTPGLSWSVKYGTGPVFISGFQPTMIFDKYLVSLSNNQTTNARNTSLADLGFEMQNFCVQGNQGYIANFVRQFTNTTQSRNAAELFQSLAQENTLSFTFSNPSVGNSTFNADSYLKKTYRNMTLQTGNSATDASTEQFGYTNNRPGLAISHVADFYNTTPDFLMVSSFRNGMNLSAIVDSIYSDIPAIMYNVTLPNGTLQQLPYRSPIGPGILRILDSMGYSTILTRTNYTTNGNAKIARQRSLCDDSSSSTSTSQSPAKKQMSDGHRARSSPATAIGGWLVAFVSIILTTGCYILCVP
ncbi:hypothetical protein BCR43DRAFT_475413 [Syncephalastrum racemosum]|uniref:Uncharacterized protein n=1 Tax=Syncephalastrum racemosum TaxID=13706 RepID=A0A1X2HA44_SYNRA|nr:hypothetical protein BCR43DRAFT_475413 [Syncephalastrum racemosum]